MTKAKNHYYYWQGETNSAKGKQLQDKVCEFFDRWLVPIGIAIDERYQETKTHPWLDYLNDKIAKEYFDAFAEYFKNKQDNILFLFGSVVSCS